MSKKDKILNMIKKQNGITLVALVVTIVVLIILAGITIMYVMGDNSVFKSASEAKEQTAIAQAKEKLEMVLTDALMQKNVKGLTEQELTEKIKQIGTEIPKEDANSNEQQIIVDGYIFEIDRSVPKMIGYVAPANGIIITAYITGSNGWIQQDEAVEVKGKIIKSGGGTVISSSATAKTISTGNTSSIVGFPTKGGEFTISNISEDTDITITATDSEGNEPVTKTIEVRIKRDATKPTVATTTAISDGLKITFTATGHDKNASGQEESGINHFNYTITSTQDPTLAGIPENQRTGTFPQGQTVKVKTSPIEDRDEITYKIKVTATDNCNNTTLDANAKTATVTVKNIMSMEEVYEIDTVEEYKENIGKKVDYKKNDGTEVPGTWRLFYVDFENNTNPSETSKGYFGDKKGTIYLRRDYKSDLIGPIPLNSSSSIPSAAYKIFEQLNPKWKVGVGGSAIDKKNEIGASWLCDETNPKWSSYKVSWQKSGDSSKKLTANWVTGAASIEMWTKAYNVYRDKYEKNDSSINCGILNELGYGYGLNGGELLKHLNNISIDTSIPESNVIAYHYSQWSASPSGAGDEALVCRIYDTFISPAFVGDYECSYNPVVSLSK